MNLLQQYYSSFKKHSTNQAFCIGGEYFSYSRFWELINGSWELIIADISGKGNAIGVVCYDAIETYAAIFATWFSGNYFVPINPKHPLERNMQMVRNTGIQFVFSARPDMRKIIDPAAIRILNNRNVASETEMPLVEVEGEQLLYVLTTSGSTGEPKYVPISLRNLEVFCRGFLSKYPELNQQDCFLQTYDLTSDAAFTGYLIPLLIGGCVCTIPDSKIKFLSIAGLLSNKKITWVQVTPSVLNYLEPYLPSLDLKHIKHFHFGGEALHLSQIKSWWPAFPDAEISNVYGPTETTITATLYKCNNLKSLKSFKGIISIGKPLDGIECLIIDENLDLLNPGETGELCIGGKQVMAGYLGSICESFLKLEIEGNSITYYRTGDLVKMGKDGYLYYLGRLDDQVKINGYRLNLGEVEQTIRNLLPGHNVVVFVDENPNGILVLYALVEKYEGDVGKIMEQLNELLPPYMIPKAILKVPYFPVASSGKIDKKKLISENQKRFI